MRRKADIPSPILTAAEAAAWLRLGPNDGGPANPSQTLKYYRTKGLLKAARIGRYYRYPVWELKAFVRRQTEREGGQ